MIAEIERFKELLKAHRYFVTKQRVELFELLQNRSALSVNQLLSLRRNQDQATIYRNIKIFEELGIISRLQLGWHSKLELSDAFHHHHHHLSCLKCSKVISLPENAIIEKQIAALAQSKSFQPTDHQLEIRGICPNCQ